ncbi:hypothetical protein J7L60_00350 [Candidatus Bathyarchaeota archaeon]|nr:hypothetical protein [Candidatus Bathyarchaeota archaeon]
MTPELQDEDLIRDALRIVEEARRRGVVLRLMGALAIRVHTPEFSELHRRLSRLGGGGSQFTDVDMMTYRSQREAAHRVFTSLGYRPDRLVMAYFGESRFLYHHPQGLYQIDLFFERLRFSHDLDLGPGPGEGRLELDYPTLTPADLLLEKLQIHEIDEKDIKDLVVLLREHRLSEGEEGDSISLSRVASVLSRDWGFWYDAKANLKKVLEFSRRYREEGLLDEEDLEDVTSKVEEILRYVDETPKTREWLRRARVGARKRWWREVEELIR